VAAAWLEERGVSYVMAIRRSDTFTMPEGERRADDLIAAAPPRSWQKISAGAGAHGPREYHWTRACQVVLTVPRSGELLVEVQLELRVAVASPVGMPRELRFHCSLVSIVCRCRSASSGTEAEQMSRGLVGRIDGSIGVVLVADRRRAVTGLRALVSVGMTMPDPRIILRGDQNGLANDPIVDHPGQPADYIHGWHGADMAREMADRRRRPLADVRPHRAGQPGGS
jgi:hypothetical protein